MVGVFLISVEFQHFLQQRRSSLSPIGSYNNEGNCGSASLLMQGPIIPEAKKMKKEDSDGDKSDGDLVVDDDTGAGGDCKNTTTDRTSNINGKGSPREHNSNANNDSGSKREPLSPSSARSTPASAASGKKDDLGKTTSSSPGAGKTLPPKSSLSTISGRNYVKAKCHTISGIDIEMIRKNNY